MSLQYVRMWVTMATRINSSVLYNSNWMYSYYVSFSTGISKLKSKQMDNLAAVIVFYDNDMLCLIAAQSVALRRRFGNRKLVFSRKRGKTPRSTVPQPLTLKLRHAVPSVTPRHVPRRATRHGAWEC